MTDFSIPSFFVLYVLINFNWDMQESALTCNLDNRYIIDINYVRDPLVDPKVC